MEPDAPARKLTLSTSDKHVWGVAGGLGRYFGVDPMLFRVAFGVSVVFGGIGIASVLTPVHANARRAWRLLPARTVSVNQVFRPRPGGEPELLDAVTRTHVGHLA